MLIAFLKHWRFFAMLGTFAFMFVAGWKVHGWKLGYEFNQAEFARQENFRKAMEANAAWVAKVNEETAAREQSLLVELEEVKHQSEELRNEIQNRPVIRQVVREAVVSADGSAVCPPTPSVDWSVFQDLYNRAATGETSSSDSGGSDAAVSSDPSYLEGGSGGDLDDRSF
jgi:hypothetical protein